MIENLNLALTQLEHALLGERVVGLPKSWFDELVSSEKLQFYALSEDTSFHVGLFNEQIKLNFISSVNITEPELALLARAVSNGLGCQTGSVQLIIGTPDELLLNQLLADSNSLVILGLDTSFLDSLAHTLVKLGGAQVLKTFGLTEVLASSETKRKFWQDLQLLIENTNRI